MIELKNICVTFGEKKVLDSFSHTFESNSFTCILGASGCGKTTLLRVASGLLKPDSGTVASDEKKLSFVFQENRFLPWLSVLDNITFAGAERQKAMQCLDNLLLSDSFNKLPRELSGGMLRRVSLARSLAVNSSCLLLDEPLRELDEETLSAAQALIKKEAQAKTVLMVTHSTAQASALADNILKLMQV